MLKHLIAPALAAIATVSAQADGLPGKASPYCDIPSIVRGDMLKTGPWRFTIALLVMLLGVSAASAEQPGIRCVQSQLDALGFYAGEPDGSIGPRTRAAAEDYRTWMSDGAGNPGWRQAPLTAMNGLVWCNAIAKDHPDTAKYVTAESKSPAQLVVQLRGNVPARLRAQLIWEERNEAECSSPCQIGRKNVTFVRDSGGLASLSIALPGEATRACINNIGGAVLKSAVLYATNGKTHASDRGGDLQDNGKSACSYAHIDAKDAVTWVLTLE